MSDVHVVRCLLPSTVTYVDVEKQVNQHIQYKRGIHIGESLSGNYREPC